MTSKQGFVSQEEIAATLVLADIFYIEFQIEKRLCVSLEEFETMIRRGKWSSGLMKPKENETLHSDPYAVVGMVGVQPIHHVFSVNQSAGSIKDQLQRVLELRQEYNQNLHKLSSDASYGLI